ncbi:MAG: hypothetical protein FWD71_06400 [Oscillospiraceae bacterium]|nr:hypothetical protein [Oscillospiraceae bacterium]
MNKTILQQLFDGEIFPSENINPTRTNPEYHKINHIISDEINYFSDIFSEKDIERFNKFNEAQNLNSGIYGEECFTYGFRLGASLLIEIFYDINNHRNTDSD